MKKLISLSVTLFLTAIVLTQNVAAANFEENENEEIVFLSLTKNAEPLSDLTTNLTIITEEEIKEKNAKNLGEIIEGELGIAYKNNGPLGQVQSVFMRGSTSSQTLVLIDGRRVNSISTGTADFTAIPANMIERVEIIRGSGAAIYGTGAFGGVINVITKKATPLTPNVNPYFSYGTFNTINTGITGAYANDVISILIAPSMLSSDGYRKNSFYDSKNIFGKIGVNLTENSEIILSGQAYNADIGNPGSATQLWLTPSKDWEDNNYLNLDYNTKIENFKIQLSGYNANYNRKYVDISNVSKYNTIDTGIKGNVSYKDFLTLGLEWSKSEFKKKDFDIENVNKNRETSAAYLQAILTFGDLTLIPVVRGDLNTDYENVFTPALSAVYKVTDEIKLSGNASKVWKAPTFDDLYWPYTKDDYYWSITEGNPNVKPEKGWAYDLGVEYSQGKFTGMVTGFYIDSEDLIDWGESIDPITGYTIYKPENIEKTRQYGYEIGLKYDMCKEVSHKLNYTYTRAEDTKNHVDLDYIPMHNLNYAIVVKPIKALKISANVSYVTTTIYSKVGRWNPTPKYLDDYCIVNARVDYQIMKYVSLWVKGNNLTNDDKYQLSYGYPMPGITGTAGIDVRF